MSLYLYGLYTLLALVQILKKTNMSIHHFFTSADITKQYKRQYNEEPKEGDEFIIAETSDALNYKSEYTRVRYWLGKWHKY
jgi:hypothetical protein